MRTPMPWRDTPGGGFTDPDTRPWLPLGDTARNVESQRADPLSMLSFARDLLSLRKQTPDLSAGAYAALPAPEGVWAWQRGEHHAVYLNCSDNDVSLDGLEGCVRIGTDRTRDGEDCVGSLPLGGWEGLIVEIGPT
jgi:alpha-glucosidase